MRNAWDVWLILLVNEARCAVPPLALLETMLAGNEDWPHMNCRISSGKRCPAVIRFCCSSRPHFEKMYQRYCITKYDTWRNIEMEKKALHRAEDDNPLAQRRSERQHPAWDHKQSSSESSSVTHQHAASGRFLNLTVLNHSPPGAADLHIRRGQWRPFWISAGSC